MDTKKLRIKEILADKGWRQKDLALKLDISPQQVSNMLSGSYPASTAMLTKVADALGVTFAELFLAPVSSRPSFVALIKDGEASYAAFSWRELRELAEKHLEEE